MYRYVYYEHALQDNRSCCFVLHCNMSCHTTLYDVSLDYSMQLYNIITCYYNMFIVLYHIIVYDTML